MYNNNNKLQLVLLLGIVAFTYAAPKQWSGNGHYYDVVSYKSAKTIEEVLVKIDQLPSYQGFKGYLATISTKEENDFISTQLGEVTFDIISGSNAANPNEWRYISGPEKGNLIYTQSSGVCSTYCPWEMIDPTDSSSTENYPNAILEEANFIMLLGKKWVNLGFGINFIVEYGGLLDPIVPPVPSTGGDVVITNFVNDEKGKAWDLKSSLTFRVTNADSDYDFNPTLVSTTATTATINFPAGLVPSGNTLQITSSLRSINLVLAYQAPAVTLVYAPALTMGSVITLTGQNLGNDASMIQIALNIWEPESPNFNCLDVAILDPHTAITCKLQKTYDINSETFYYAPTMNAIRSFAYPSKLPALVMNSIASSSPLDFNAGYMGVVQNAAQADLIYTIDSSPGSQYFEGLTGAYASGYTFLNVKGGPYTNGTSAVAANFASCSPNVLCKFTGSKTSQGQLVFNGHTHDTISMYGAGELTYYGVAPTQVANFLRVDTTGGNANFYIGGSAGFRYTKRAYSIGLYTGSASNIKLVAANTLSLYIPPGTGTTKTISVTLESFPALAGTILYNPPTVSSATKVLTTGGVTTITGTNFGNNNAQISVSIYETPCLNAAIQTAHTVITCNAGAGSGTTSKITVQVEGQSVVAPFSYLPPTIQSISQSGTSLSFIGSSFGPSVLFKPTTTPPSTLGSLNINIPQTYVANFSASTKNGDFTITVSGQTSAPFAYSLTPVITSISPARIPTGTKVIVINGAFLNLVRQNGDAASVSIMVGSIPCTLPSNSVSESSMSISCTLVGGSGMAVPINLIIDNKASNVFTVDFAPVISGVTINGQLITISGTSFGSDLSTASVIFNGVSVKAASLSAGTVTATIPAATRNGFVTVSFNNDVSQGFPFELTPIISSVSSGPTTGGLITISGMFLNSMTYSGTPITRTVTIANVGDCALSAPTVNTEMICTVLAGTGKGLVITATIGSKSTTSTYAYQAPSITSITSNAQSITFAGTNFGTNPAKITIGLSTGDLIPTFSGANLVVPTPTNALNGPVRLTVDGQTSDSKFLALTPILTAMTQAPPTSGGIVQFTGKFLSLVRSDNSIVDVSILLDGSIVCGSVTSPSANVLQCIAPAGSGVRAATVTIDSVISNSVPLTYLAPTLTGFIQDKRVVNISGTNFGLDASLITVSFGLLKTTAQHAEDTNLVVFIPTFALSGQLFVTIGGAQSNSISYQLAPIIESVTSPNPTGGLVTISGYFLNNVHQNGSNTVMTATLQNRVKCEPINKIPNSPNFSLLTCSVPSGTGANTLTLTIDGLSDSGDFRYGGPVIGTVKNNANTFTLTGTGFGSVQTDIQLFWGANPITAFTLSGSNIIFKAQSTYLNSYVYLVIDGLSSNRKSVNLQPTITQVTRSPTTGSDCTITGEFINPKDAGNNPNNFVLTFDGAPVLIKPNDAVTGIVFAAPVGSGIGHTIILSIDELSTTYSNFAYLPPTLNSINQKGKQITMFGSNFGIVAANVSLIPGFTVQSVTHTSIVATLAPTLLSGPFQVTISKQASNSLNFKVAPIIASVSSASPNGGQVTIQGSYMNAQHIDGSATTVTAQFDDNVNCVFVTAATSYMVCTLPNGTLIDADVLVTIDGQSDFVESLYTSSSPVITSASSLTLGQAGTVTVKGANYIVPLQVTIGDSPCTSAVLVDDHTLTCQYDAVAVQDSALVVNVTANGLSGAAAVFLYNENTCPAACVAPNGQCLFGYCVCASGFAGPTCATNVTALATPTQNKNQVTFPIDKYEFTSALTTIAEVDSSNTMVSQLTFDNILWTLASTSTDAAKETNVFVGNFSTNPTIITLTTTYFTQAANASYIGETIPVPSNTVKHSISISGWVFASQSNSLQVIYRGSAPTSIEYNCEGSPSAPMTYKATNDQLNAFTIDSQAGILVAQFSRRGLVDNRAMYIAVTELAVGGPLSPAINGQTPIYVAVNIPAFASSASFDPSFVAYTKAATCIPEVTTTDASTTGSSSILSIPSILSLLSIMIVSIVM
eukprot:gene7342-8550_t